MPRIARKNYDATFYHIIVQGIEKNFIFEKEIFKRKYLELMLKQEEKNNVTIIAYCIMDNHVHVLVNTDKISSMSKFMHNVNSEFAQFYNYIEDNRVGYVFRDRFKSEPICNEKYLINCIKYIHNNPVKAKIVNKAKDYKYSSYNDYLNKKRVGLNKIISEMIDVIILLNDEMENNGFLDVDMDNKIILESITNKYVSKYEITKKQMVRDKDILNKIILEMKNNYKIKYVEIADWFGISKVTVRRIAKENLECPQNDQK